MIHTRRLNYRTLLVLVLVISCVGTFLLIMQKSINHERNVITRTRGSVPIVTSSLRSVTKSLAELRHGIEIPELSDHVVFFNRVPKTGSEMLVLLLQWLQGMNGFRHIRLGGGRIRKLNRMQQVSFFVLLFRSQYLDLSPSVGHKIVCDFGLPPRCKLGLPCCVLFSG
jgi:dermatan/chondrotin sulfate uronyl 2-O-sulfotransferase UST